MTTPVGRGPRIDTVAVVGGSGLIGTKVVAELRTRGHRVVAASRSHGIDVFSGEGLEDAFRQVSVVVDVTNPGADAARDPLSFFTTSTRNLLAAESRLGVRHHVLVSIVGTDRLADAADGAQNGAGYFQAKLAQENLVRTSGIPFTIVRSTQFFEFVPVIADASTVHGTVRVPPAWLQPVAADDVAREVADVAEGSPANTTVEFAGPVRMPFEEVVGLTVGTANDSRRILTDPGATYFGVPVEPDTFLPRSNARLGVVTLSEWVGATSIASGG